MIVRLFFAIILLPFFSQAQPYYVSKVGKTGEIYLGNTQIKSGDLINEVSELRATDPAAMLRVVHDTKGSYTILFNTGSRQISLFDGRQSEFYKLVIKDYVDKYNKYRSLSTKKTPPSDWFEFFNSASIDTSSGTIALLENDMIPLQSKSINLASNFILYSCMTDNNGDSSCTQIPVINDSLYFDSSLFKGTTQFLWKLKISEPNSTNPTLLPVTDRPLKVNILKNTTLHSFIREQTDILKHDQIKITDIRNEIFALLEFNYGSHFSPYIDKMINSQY